MLKNVKLGHASKTLHIVISIKSMVRLSFYAIFSLIFMPILTYGYKWWLMTKRVGS